MIKPYNFTEAFYNYKGVIFEASTLDYYYFACHVRVQRSELRSVPEYLISVF